MKSEIDHKICVIQSGIIITSMVKHILRGKIYLYVMRVRLPEKRWYGVFGCEASAICVRWLNLFDLTEWTTLRRRRPYWRLVLGSKFACDRLKTGQMSKRMFHFRMNDMCLIHVHANVTITMTVVTVRALNDDRQMQFKNWNYRLPMFNTSNTNRTQSGVCSFQYSSFLPIILVWLALGNTCQRWLRGQATKTKSARMSQQYPKVYLYNVITGIYYICNELCLA